MADYYVKYIKFFGMINLIAKNKNSKKFIR